MSEQPPAETDFSSLDQWLVEKRRALGTRLSPQEAFDMVEQGAWLIDTRPLEKKMKDGIVPGAIQIGLDVLPWRIHPDAENQTVYIKPGEAVVILCDHGYSSSVAAAELRELGFNATDIEGGYQAWVEAGLPWSPYQASN